MSNPNDIYDHFVMLQNRILSRLTVTDAHVDPVANIWPFPVPAHPDAKVAFLTERVGDFSNKLAQAIGTLGGLACIVLTPTAKMREPGMETLDLLAPVIIQVQENVLINQGVKGTKIPALLMVALIMRRLQGFCHQLYDGDPLETKLLLDPRPFVLLKATNPVTYNVAALAPLDLAARLPQEYDDLLFDDGSVVQYA